MLLRLKYPSLIFLLLMCTEVNAQIIIPNEVNLEEMQILEQFNCVARHYEVINDQPGISNRFHTLFFADSGMYHTDLQIWALAINGIAINLQELRNYLSQTDESKIPSELSALKTCFIDDEERFKEFVLYPNPTKGEVTMAGSFAAGDQISVLDIESGHILVDKSINTSTNSEMLSLTRFPIGLYLVSIKGKSEAKQFIVIKN